MNIFKLNKKCYKYLYNQKLKFWFLNFLKVIFFMVSLLPAYATSNVIANLKSSEVSSVMIMIAGLGASYILYLFLDLIIFFLRQNVEKNARTYLKKVFMRKLFEHQEIQTDTSKITEILYTDVNNVINLLFIVFDLGINVLFAMLLGAML